MIKVPLISVIVPIYNVEDYLERCLDSIVGQSYKKLEIILVNDGSTDSSSKIVDTYAKRDTRIRVIHKNNGGLSDARNVGLKHATGEYVAFVDSDDYVAVDFIEKLHLTASKNDADIASCQFQAFSEEKLKLKNSPVWPFDAMTGYESIVDILIKMHPAYIWMSLFRRSLFIDNKIEFPVGRTYEDGATRFKLQYFANKVAFTNEKLYYYLIREDSITGIKFSVTRFNDLIFAVETIRDFCNKRKDIDLALVDYFDFKTTLLVLNYLTREHIFDKLSSKYWIKSVRRLNKLYSRIKFPSTESRITYTCIYVLAHFRILYTILYKIKRAIA